MKRYQFTATVAVDGVLRKAGEVVPEAEIPSGCLVSMLRLGQVVEVPDAKTEQAAKKK